MVAYCHRPRVIPFRGCVTPEGHCWNAPMLTEWNLLSDQMQLVLAKEAFRQALVRIIDNAGSLAGAMEVGAIVDRGGPEALRLFVSVVTETHHECVVSTCHA